MFGWLFRKRSRPTAVSYARFTDRARKVMQLANQEAQRSNHESVGTEHILLGLVKEADGFPPTRWLTGRRGVAAEVIESLGVELPAVRQEVERVAPPGPAGDPPAGRRPHVAAAKRAIEYAIEEARSLGHDYVGTEHLLLGLLRASDGAAAVALANLGLDADRVRAEVRARLGT